MSSTALIVIALLAYTGGILAFGRGPAHINANILGTIVNFIATLVPLGLFTLVASQRYTTGGTSTKGYAWALFGGVCIGVFTLAMTKLFDSGENVSFVTPLVYGGAILLASVASVLFFNERLTLPLLTGLSFIVVGICVVSYSSWKGVN